jgi:hypothetical protein
MNCGWSHGIYLNICWSNKLLFISNNHRYFWFKIRSFVYRRKEIVINSHNLLWSRSYIKWIYIWWWALYGYVASIQYVRTYWDRRLDNLIIIKWLSMLKCIIMMWSILKRIMNYTAMKLIWLRIYRIIILIICCPNLINLFIIHLMIINYIWMD